MQVSANAFLAFLERFIGSANLAIDTGHRCIKLDCRIELGAAEEADSLPFTRHATRIGAEFGVPFEALVSVMHEE